MKHFLLSLLLLAASAGLMAAPQDTRPPLSKGDVLDLLVSAAPSKVVISEIKQYGIAFKPTPEILEEFRKAGADKAVLAALGGAYREEIPNPLGDEEIRRLLDEDEPSEGIVKAVLRRGIDFQPTPDYLKELRAEGAKDVLIDALRTAVPRPLSKGELLHLLTTRVDQQEWIARKVRERGIDFEPGNENLQALRNAGARPPLLETVRTAKRAEPFVAQTAAGPSLVPPHGAGHTATLICGPADSDVPVLADPNDQSRIVARLFCGEHVTFLGRPLISSGFDKIQYADGKEGFVASSYLEGPIATPGKDVTAPSPIYRPEPSYTPEARQDGIEGTLTFSIVIDKQGNVTDVQERSKALGDGLDQSAIDTLKTWKFNPATRGGVPVPVRVMVEISFRLH